MRQSPLKQLAKMEQSCLDPLLYKVVRRDYTRCTFSKSTAVFSFPKSRSAKLMGLLCLAALCQLKNKRTYLPRIRHRLLRDGVAPKDGRSLLHRGSHKYATRRAHDGDIRALSFVKEARIRMKLRHLRYHPSYNGF